MDNNVNLDIQAALFDIDGTLTTGEDFWDVLIYSPKVSLARRTQLYAKTVPIYALVKGHLANQARFRSRWVHYMAGLMRGWEAAEVDALCNDIVRERLVPGLRPDVVRLLNGHKAAGHPVLLVSTMFESIVRGLAQHLGADVGIGTPVEMHDGYCTGCVVGETCSGTQKAQYVQRYFETHTPELSLAACAAYADSQSDVPFLMAVGHPTAVYPDHAMRRAAEQHRWPIHEVID